MRDLGLQYEAYSVRRDIYISDTGSRLFVGRTHYDTTGTRAVCRTRRRRKQVVALFHPDWWTPSPVRPVVAAAKASNTAALAPDSRMKPPAEGRRRRAPHGGLLPRHAPSANGRGVRAATARVLPRPHPRPDARAGLQRFLDLPLVFQPFGRPRSDAVTIVGWGLKGSRSRPRWRRTDTNCPTSRSKTASCARSRQATPSPACRSRSTTSASTTTRGRRRASSNRSPPATTRPNSHAPKRLPPRGGRIGSRSTTTDANERRRCPGSGVTVRARRRPDFRRRVDPPWHGRRVELCAHARGRAGRASERAG